MDGYLSLREAAEKWGRVGAADQSILHPGPYSRRAQIREILGHPSARPEAGGPPPDQEQGPGPACPPAGGSAGRPDADAFDEYPLCTRQMSGRCRGHRGRAPAGHRAGGISLFQRPAGGGGGRGGSLSGQPRPGGPGCRPACSTPMPICPWGRSAGQSLPWGS